MHTVQQRAEGGAEARWRRQDETFVVIAADLLQHAPHAGHIDQVADNDDALDLLGASGVDRDKGNNLANQRDERRRQVLVADGDILTRQTAKVDGRGRCGQRADRPTDDVAQAATTAVPEPALTTSVGAPSPPVANSASA
jgi:hypothetical protein